MEDLFNYFVKGRLALYYPLTQFTSSGSYLFNGGHYKMTNQEVGES